MIYKYKRGKCFQTFYRWEAQLNKSETVLEF